MTGAHPQSVVDPVCGMSVNVEHAEAEGLTATYEGRKYAFCRSRCLATFLEAPDAYASKVVAADVAESATFKGTPVIDEGMRRWYDSCSCCLSDAYPEIKAALDAERVAGAIPPIAAGICEVADATQEVLA